MKLDYFSKILSKNVIYSKTDISGIIVEVSDQFCEISGYTRDELIGNNHSILRHKEMSNKVYKNLWITIKSAKEWNGEIKNLKKNGDAYWVNTNITPEFNSEGLHTGYISIRHDITSEKLYEELSQTLEGKVLEKTQKIDDLNKNLQKQVDIQVLEMTVLNDELMESAKLVQVGEMMESIAHQWRQPLNVINSIVLNLELKESMAETQDEKFKDNLVTIKEQVSHLSESVGTFRTYLIPDNKKGIVHLQKELNDIFIIAMPSLRESYISLNKDLIEEPLNASMNKGELAQVVINVINNAKDVLVEKKVNEPWINVSLIKKEKIAIISIEDNGGGIPKDILPKIFDSHFTTKETRNGTGIGLHMGKRIVEESLNGKFYAENTEYGAKFFIEIPI